METDHNKINQTLETLPSAFARHQIVLDEQNNPVDYVFLAVNTAFEEMTGLKRENILGRKVTEVLPGIEKNDFDWIGVYGKVATEGKSLNFEQYSEPLKRWYEVQAYSDEPGFFTTVFNEITARKEELASMKGLLELTEELFNTDLATFDYQSAAGNLLKLSGAKFAAINTYEDDRTKTVTRAISGIPSMIESVSKLLGFKIAGQAWEIIPERLRKIEGGKLVRFSSLYETAMGALNKTTSTALHKLTGIGDIYVLELAYGGRETTGDIIFFMPKGKGIHNREVIELYAGQLGAVLGRLRSEEKLLKNEQRLSLAQVNARAGYWEYDLKEKRLYWSRECEALFGLEEGEFEGTFDAFFKRVHPEDKEYVLSKNQPITEGKKSIPLEYEHRIIKKDGTVIWIRETADTVYDKTGEAAFITGFVMDITERKKAEEDLFMQRERLSNIVEGANVATWEWNVQTGEHIVNERWAEMIGYKLEEIHAGSIETWHKFTHPVDLAMSNNEMEKLFKGEVNFYNVENRRKHKNGQWIWVNDRGKVISWTDDGKPLWLFGTLIDITGRKEAEEALSERLAFEKMVSQISTIFINQPPEELDMGLNEALKVAGQFFGADRSYLYAFSEDGKTYSITHTWCAPGIKSYYEKDQNRQVRLQSCWAGELLKGNTVIINDVESMPPGQEEDKKDFLSEEIKSLLSIPLAGGGKVFGCFGLDHVNQKHTWAEGQVNLLQVVAELFAGALARHKNEKTIRRLSFHDQLTGLYNRRYFENELERLDSSREHPVTVISADLDGLKLINDTLGHSEGDRYLQAGADLLKNTLRESDILARVGGDEFALLLPRTGKVEAELLTNRIRCQIDNYNREQINLPLSISLGLAVSENPEYSLEEVFRMADNNMYTEKLEQGKKARTEIVSSLLASLFKRDNLAEGERAQVQELAIRLGLALKLEESRMADLELLAQVYDLGKVSLPDNLLHQSILENTEELTEAEREAIHRHPETGYRIALASPDLAGVAELILRHHENYDGSGYPLGLIGEMVPVECRILAIAIAYSAMTHPRPYGRILTHEEALAELKRCAGSQFDPQLVEIFNELIEKDLNS